MELILTGDFVTGAEFQAMGLINKVFPKEEVLPASIKVAERIANMSAPVVNAAKQAVLAGMTLYSQSLDFLC